MQEEIVQEFIRNYNNDLKTSIPVDSYKFIGNLFKKCVGPEFSNEFEQQNMNELEKITDTLYNSFDNEQRELFDKFDNLKNDMQNNVEQQLFIYGFCTAKLLDKIGNTTSK